MARAILAGLLPATLLAGCGSSARAAACSLDGSVSFQGATGNLLSGFSVKNSGSSRCRLGEFPKLELIRADGKQVELSVHRGDRAFPHGRPLRVLRPGRRATAWIKWENYCGSLWNRRFTFRLTLTTGQRTSARTGAAEKCQESGGSPALGRERPRSASAASTSFY
jgi:hypothetical protein